MNILYIDHYAGSLEMGMEFRPYYLAREWVKAGHKVRIVGASFSHLRIKNPEVKRDFELQMIGGIEYQWVKTCTYDHNGVARAVTMAQFCGKLWWNAKRIADEFQPDVVISSSTYPLDTYVAQRISKFMARKALIVHEVHDMWPITPMELNGMSEYHPFVILMQWAENSFCRNSDLVVSILPCSKEYLVQHGMSPNKFIHIPNGIDLSDWERPAELPPQHKAVLKKAHSEGRLVIGFFGSHTRSYNVDILIKAFAESDQDKLFVAFVGSGDCKDKLIGLSDELKLKKSSYAFLPAIPKTAIPSLVEELDVCYVSVKKNKMSRFGIAMNKLFDSMMSGKPLLYAVEAPNNFVEEYNCGISVEAENVEALRVGISKFLVMTPFEREQLGANGKKAVIENYNYRVISQKFINAFSSFF